MKYKLVWMDSFNAYNWADDDLIAGEDMEIDILNNGIENIKEMYSNIVIENQDIDGWIDCQIIEEFEAKNIKEIKKKVEEILDENGRIVDVFGVVDETGKEILTEEDFYG